MTTQVYLSDSPEQTLAVGRTLGRQLTSGDLAAPTWLVLLQGELGVGKTHFVKGLATAFGITPEEVTSPTFALVQAHPFSGGTLWHIDLYRLPTGAPIVDAIGLEEILEQPGIVVIEWPERLGKALEALIEQQSVVCRVNLEEVDETTRRITIHQTVGPAAPSDDRRTPLG